MQKACSYLSPHQKAKVLKTLALARARSQSLGGTPCPRTLLTFFWHDCLISSTSSSRLSTSLACVCRSLSISISSRSLACREKLLRTKKKGLPTSPKDRQGAKL